MGHALFFMVDMAATKRAARLVLEDLRQVHPETYLSLRSLLSWEPEEDLMAEELLESAFSSGEAMGILELDQKNGGI